jgi:hypothetical protein
MTRYFIHRKSDHQRTAYDNGTLVNAIKSARTLAKGNRKAYVVCYPSGAPIVTVTAGDKLHWH